MKPKVTKKAMPITKVCPDCAKQMPTACKSCSSCNYMFRRDVSLPSPPAEAGLDGKLILEFERADFADLMPGPTMFLMRRKLWNTVVELKEGLLKQLKRRLANLKPISRPQGKQPNRSKVHRILVMKDVKESMHPAMMCSIPESVASGSGSIDSVDSRSGSIDSVDSGSGSIDSVDSGAGSIDSVVSGSNLTDRGDVGDNKEPDHTTQENGNSDFTVTRDDATTAASTTVVRRTERTRRERPDYFDAMEYEQYFKRERRKRSFSHSSASDDSCKKRGRPKGSIIKEKLHNKEVSTETNDSRSSGESVVKDEDLFASIPPEKAMQFAIILAEINRKCTSQQFNPT